MCFFDKLEVSQTTTTTVTLSEATTTATDNKELQKRVENEECEK